MKKIFFMTLFLLATMVGQGKGKGEFTVLRWNIWQEGTMVSEGYDAIANEIVRLQPDFVAFNEVCNYHNTHSSDRIMTSLKEEGLDCYSFYTCDTGLLSKHPTTDLLIVFPKNGGHESIYKLTSSVGGHKVAIYTAHLGYLDCACYNVRGYDGSSRKEVPTPTIVEEVLKVNVASQRNDAIKMFIVETKKDITNGYNVIVNGGFNEPSHLDWIEENKNLCNHNGFVIPWIVTALLEKDGFIDTYCHIYPNPLTHPGFTCSADNPLKEPGKLTWAPKAGERDRIDFTFYRGKDIEAKEAMTFDPKGSVVRNQGVQKTSKDGFLLPLNVRPTDHKGLLVTFKMK